MTQADGPQWLVDYVNKALLLPVLSNAVFVAVGEVVSVFLF